MRLAKRCKIAMGLGILFAGTRDLASQDPLRSPKPRPAESQAQPAVLDWTKPVDLLRAVRRLYLGGDLGTLLDAIAGRSASERDLVRLGLGAGGLEVARDLIPYLGDKNLARREAALGLLLALEAKEALIQSLHHPDPDLRKRARLALSLLGRSSLPRLIEEVRSSDLAFREEAFLILAGMGLSAARDLGSLIDDRAFFSRVSPILIAYGNAGFRSLLDHWQHLDDGQKSVILAQMRNRSPRSQRILLGIVRFADHEQARNAIDVLVLQGDAESLLQALGLARATVQARALSGLKTLGKLAIPEITEALRDHDPRLRHLALERLKDLGPAAWPSLAGLLVGGDPALRLEAVTFLIQAGEKGIQALALARAGTDGRSLALLHPSLRKKRSLLIPPLLQGLDSKQGATLSTSLEILLALEAWDELARSLRKKNPVLGAALHNTLVRGGRAVVPAILAEMLRNKASSHPACLAVLKSLGSEAIPPLVSALKDPFLRAPATTVLQELTRPASPGR